MKSSIPMTFGKRTENDFSFSVQSGKDDFYFYLHWHDCYEIILVRNGSFVVTIDKTDIRLNCGDMAIIPPGVLHSTASTNGEYDVLVFGYTENLIYTPDISFNNIKYILPVKRSSDPEDYIARCADDDARQMTDMLLRAYEAYTSDSTTKDLLIRAEILRLHAKIYERLPGKRTFDNAGLKYLADAELYISEHISEDISPYDIAHKLHLSYSHFSRVIRECLGISVSDLIAGMKISKAEQLILTSPNTSITEIALTLGYGSSGYFTRIFKKERGCTPTEFKRMYVESAIS